MSLPNWICCPKCGGVAGLKRLGNVGVPPSMYGKRKRTKDSKRMLCTDCNVVFKTGGINMWEAMGRDPREEVPY